MEPPRPHHAVPPHAALALPSGSSTLSFAASPAEARQMPLTQMPLTPVKEAETSPLLGGKSDKDVDGGGGGLHHQQHAGAAGSEKLPTAASSDHQHRWLAPPKLMRTNGASDRPFPASDADAVEALVEAAMMMSPGGARGKAVQVEHISLTPR